MRRSAVFLSVRTFLALTLFCACAAGRLSAQLSAPTQQRQMPDVVGLSSEQAAGRLRQIGLSVQTRDVPSPQARGTVVAQSPAAGAGIKTGQGATLDVSTGPSAEQTQTGGQATGGGGRATGGVDVQVRPPRPGLVPDLAGMSRNSARLRLMLSGLALGAVDSAWVEGARGGRVVGQDPQPGTQVLPGRRVRVTLASRTPPLAQPQPDTEPKPQRPELVVVPDVSGQTADQARAAVGRARLLVGTVDSARAGSSAPETVLAQSPAAGERVQPGSFVTLTLAQSARVAMPSLVGRPVAEARRMLAAAGLRPGGVTEREERGRAGRVLTQSIPPGTQVRPGTAVDLAVSRVPAARPDTPVAANPAGPAQRDTPVRTAQQDSPAATRPAQIPTVDSALTPTIQSPVTTPPAIVPAQTTARETAAVAPVRRSISRPGTPAWRGIPREVLWGVVTLLVLAAAAVLYRLTRRGARTPVQPTPSAPAPVSCAVRLRVGGGEWESAATSDAAAEPALRGKLRLNVAIAEPRPIAQSPGEAALGATRVAVRVAGHAAGAPAWTDDAAPVLAGAAVQVRVRDEAPTLTMSEDTPIIQSRR